jgi:hemerythrin
MTLSAENKNKLKDIKSILYGMEIDYERGNIDHGLDKIKTDIPLIDLHHQQLLELVIALFRMLDSSKLDENKLKSLLEELIVYSLEHFAYEEKLMQEAGYPDIDKHRHQHNNFNLKLDGFLRELRAKVELYDYAIRLNLWLVEWYSAEILHNDRKMALFLQRKKSRMYAAAGGIGICLVAILLILIYRKS